MVTRSTSQGAAVRRARRAALKQFAVVCAVLTVPALFTTNSALTVAGLATLFVIFALLWSPGEPPVLAFATFFQWMQVYVPVLVADARGERIGESLRSYQWLPEMGNAAWLGLIAMIVLAAGMRLGLRNSRRETLVVDTVAVRELTVRKLIRAYVIAFVVGFIVTIIGSMAGGLAQPLRPLASLRMIVAFMLFSAALREIRFRPIALWVLATEVALGFTGYFGEFKSVLFLAVVAIAGGQINFRKILRPTVVAVFLLGVLLACYWQAIKRDYRDFISAGAGAQVVLVPLSDRIDFLWHAAVNMTPADLEDGFVSGLGRLGYLEFFARALETVPARVDYTKGDLWLGALKHLVTPRMFFPEKLAIDDSERTNDFTGVVVAGAEQGTSISIGYVGESYIDFGHVLMFVPILLLGWFLGWGYKWLAARTRYQLLGFAVAVNMILSNAVYFESSNIKILGGAVTFIIVWGALLGFFGGWLWRLVSSPPTETFITPPVLQQVIGPATSSPSVATAVNLSQTRR